MPGERKLRLVYAADANLPAEAANTLQVMKMCAALQQGGAEVTLLARPQHVSPGQTRLARDWPDGLADFYGVNPLFKLARPRRVLPGRSGRDKWNSIFSLSCLWWCLRRRSAFDLLYTRLPLLALLAARCGIPACYEAHRPLPAGSNLDARVAEALKKIQTRPTWRGTVAISSALAIMYHDLGWPPQTVLTEHDAVDIAPFTAVPDTVTARRQIREKVMLPEASFTVGYTGHFYDGRGIPELLACAEKYPSWTFLLVGGNARDLATYRAQAKDLPNVFFPGFVPNSQLPPYLFACDVLTMPYTAATGSNQYMSPMKMFEYLAAGRPIVASQWPSVAEVLRHEENALLVPPGDIGALNSALEMLAKDPALAQALAAAGRETAHHHTWKGRATRILQWLEQKP